MTTYTKNIITDFPNGLDTGLLHSEIENERDCQNSLFFCYHTYCALAKVDFYTSYQGIINHPSQNLITRVLFYTY